MPLDLGHTCHGLVFQMTFWLNCPLNIMHPNHHPHMTFASLPTEYVLNLKVVVCCLAICQGEFVVLDSL